MSNRYSFSDVQNILSSAKCPSVSSMSNTIVFFLIGIYFAYIIFVCDFFSVVVLYFFGRTCMAQSRKNLGIPLKSGELTKYGYSLKSRASSRHSALKKSVKAY